MTGSWIDFNDAEAQSSFDLIPRGTIVPVRMTIRPGGYDDASQGWTGGYATQNAATGSVYLNCEFVILEGLHARRKVWSLILTPFVLGAGRSHPRDWQENPKCPPIPEPRSSRQLSSWRCMDRDLSFVLLPDRCTCSSTAPTHHEHCDAR